ncbi:MAG TPA: YdeI/OmpD-associated family protein [Acidobacteriaceae bacterium]|nr:YdeI/OmpD-associated family protein [Acidobacteriaceae bacterium]
MGLRSPKVVAYIAKAKPFAQPILEHLRGLMHKGCPEVEESIKWSRPFFEYKGAILGNMSAFREHCSFGFWGQEIGMVVREAGVVRNGAMGSLGRITGVKDLPADQQMVGWIRQAAGFVDSGQYTSPIAARSRVVKPEKAQVEVPPAFTAALSKNKKAAAAFAAFSPSCRREYVEWIVEAKREKTRAERIAMAVDWIAEGKQRNWKYQ